MKHKVFKIFLAFQYEKEEKWLNEMSAKGLQLTDVALFIYTFTDNEPENYIYRLEMLDDLPSSAKGSAYIRFLEDMGVEYIGSMVRWIYVRKPASEGPFDLYSDIESKIKHYSRIRNLMLILFICFLPLAISNSIHAFGEDATLPIVPIVLHLCAEILLGLAALLPQLKINKLKKEGFLRE